MKSSLALDPRYVWHEERHGTLIAAYKGRAATVRELLSFLPAHGLPDLKLLAGPMAALPGHFAVLVQGDGWTLAVADKVAGYPAYYVHMDGKFQASNSARLLQQNWKLTTGHADALLELRMTGYVTGPQTMTRNLYKLQAGEAILWDETAAHLTRQRYYLFFSRDIRHGSENDLIDELDERTNTIIDRHMEDAADRPIVVPLSGGLDSRLILAKLKLRGYRNLWAFSYGAPRNYEAKVAKQVAEVMGVPWIFLPTTRQEARSFFYSADRRDYWDYADGLHVVPNLHAIFALRQLRDQGRFRNGAVLINGQSGDFIAGDHIPETIFNGAVGFELLHTNLMSKHYSMRRSLLHDSAVKERVAKRIVSVLAGRIEIPDPQACAKIHELWEWQARQAIRVINGQRSYDYFGLSWELPLWEKEYLNFWATVPLGYKFGRSLFRSWLEREDFFGLFRNYRPFLSRWPRHLLWIQHLGRVLRLLTGAKISRLYYDLLDYYSHYSYLYAQVPYSEYLRHCWDYRGTYPHYTNVWERENMNLFVDGFE